MMPTRSYKMCALSLLFMGAADGASFLKSLHARNAVATESKKITNSTPGCGEVVPAMREMTAQAKEKGKMLSKVHAASTKLEEAIKIAKDEKADLKVDAKKASDSGNKALASKIDDQIKKAENIEASSAKSKVEVHKLNEEISAVKPGQDVPKGCGLKVEKETAQADKDLKDAKKVEADEAKLAKVFPTYTWGGGVVTAPKNKVVKLSSALWPSDYCLDFDVTLPSKPNGNRYGYEGTIAMLGQVDLVVTHSKKLLKCAGSNCVEGAKFGFMVIEQSNGGGPYFATKGLAKPGARQKGTFCYKESTNTPSFIVNGKPEGGYLHNPSAKYPSTRSNVDLTFLSGSHTSTSVEALKGARLHAFSIRKA